MKPRTILAFSLAAAALALPASAQALTVSGTAAPTSLTAGANSDFNIAINFGPASEDVQNLVVGLPPGVTGDPTATPKCTLAQLNSATSGNDGCPANTQVGTVVANATISLGVPVTLDVSGNLYNLTPQPGEPARFGIVLQPGNLGGVLALPLDPVILQSGAALRQDDFGLDTIINDIPNTTPIPLLGDVATHINSQTITLFGTAPGTGRSFMRNPTSCTPKVTQFTATPHPPATGTATASSPPFTPTNCAALPFSPTFSAKLNVPPEVEPDTKPTLTTAIDQDNGEAGLRNAKVFVPSALSADLNELLPGEVCPLPTFQAGSCPANTIIGDAVASSPLLTSPLTGPVIVVDNPGGVAKVGLDLKGELNMKLQGQLGLDNTTTFTDLPDIPIAHFELKFNGGPGGLLGAGRDLCRPPAPVFHVDFEGHNGAVLPTDTPATVEGCGPARLPRVNVRLKRPGSKTPKLVMTAKSASKFSPLNHLKLKLPKGLAFAKGGDFDQGTSGRLGTAPLRDSAVSNSRRKLKLKLKNGSNDIRVKVGKGALRRTGGVPKKGLRFPVTVRDIEGLTTALRASR